MARRLPAVRQDLAIATVAIVGVAATLLSAALVEALTDRDRSIGEDTGIFSVTSTRVSYLGDRKNVEVPYSKLVGLAYFSDGVTLQSSSRQNAVRLQLNQGVGEIVAATINGTMQDLV